MMECQKEMTINFKKSKHITIYYCLRLYPHKLHLVIKIKIPISSIS